MALKFFNSLTKNEDEFIPLHPDQAGVYTCGPTVYDYVTIGNWRTYMLGDLVVRTLLYKGYSVNYYMNITDVGHLTGDNLGDADTGEDRIEKAKKREGKNAYDIANFYADDFKNGLKKLNFIEPKEFLYATGHIPEQIDLVQQLFDKGLAYIINDGVYFDTQAYENLGFKYGELSNLDQIKAGARVDFNPEKHNARDFALWKFSPKNEKREMEWPSPWGVGFPGWHIECSAMSMKYLGEQFDIHIGGEDLKSTHHPNEIAQSQGATGKSPFVKYWIHGAFLQVDGGRMGKSLGNAYNLHDIEKRGINPLALRYFYMTSNYNSSLNFTWQALEAADLALKNLKNHFKSLGQNSGEINIFYKNNFLEYLDDNMNLPKCLALAWGILKDSTLTNESKRATIIDFDKIFGFDLTNLPNEIPEEIMRLVERRNKARDVLAWNVADELRKEIESRGYTIKDTKSGTEVFKS